MEIRSQVVSDAILPDLSDMDFIHWMRLHGRLFDNVPSWLLHLRSLDIVVSTRIHGTQLALQAGTPAICGWQHSGQRWPCDDRVSPPSGAASQPRQDRGWGVSRPFRNSGL